MGIQWGREPAFAGGKATDEATSCSVAYDDVT
jgi:hypothetical protein